MRNLLITFFLFISFAGLAGPPGKLAHWWDLYIPIEEPMAVARTFYVSASGNDINDGLTTGTAWKTIDKVNSMFASFIAGDNILFRAGDSFYGSILVKKSGTAVSPIVIGAYGSGAKPLITGFTAATGFVNMGGNKWRSSALTNTNNPNMVAIENAVAQMGRWPDTGYRTYTTHVGDESISDPGLPASPIFTGAVVHIREFHDQISSDPITSHSGTTIHYTNTNQYTPQNGYGYFISNSLATLTVQNEWFFDLPTKRITIYSGAAPTNVKISTIDTLLFIGQYDYITVDGIAFEGANVAAVSFGGPKLGQAINTTIKNCSFNFSGNDAIYGTYDIGCSITNNIINNSLNNAIELENEGGQSINSIITSNTIKNTGLFAGMGVKYNAIVVFGPNALVQYNNIDSVGLTGVSFYYNDVRVLNNVINHYCRTVDDAGAINVFDASFGATIETGREIRNNIILNGTYGVGWGTADHADVVLGIYIDDKANGVLVQGNSVSNAPRACFYVHNGTDIVVRDNTFYSGGEAQAMFVHDDHAIGMPIRNIFFKNNILFAKPGQLILVMRTMINDIGLIFTDGLDSNIYARPAAASGTIINATTNYKVAGTKDTSYNLLTWRAAHPNYDLNTIATPANTNTSTFYSNPADTVAQIPFPGLRKKDPKDVAYDNIANVARVGSLILIDSGTSIISNIPPIANAGPNQIFSLPTNFTTLNGSGTDADGTIDTYAWVKTSGPAGGTISNASLAGPVISDLIEGQYEYELTVTDNHGATGKDRVVLTVNAGPIGHCTNCLRSSIRFIKQ